MTQQTNNHFVGRYVTDIVDAAVAGMVSRQHVILIGAPGCGKTVIARDAVNKMSDGRFSFLRLALGTSPDEVQGPYDPAKFLAGELSRNVEGTPYDPENEAVIIDEISRGNDAVFDQLIDTLDRFDTDRQPPVISTANFAPKGERAEALRSRLSLWVWVNPGDVDVTNVALANMNGHRPTLNDQTHPLPDPETVEKVRNAHPGPDAQRAVVTVLEDIADMAREQNRGLSHRLVSQWAQILFRMSVLITGDENFTTVPPQAVKVLRFCYPNTTQQEAADWEEIIRAVADIVETAVEDVLASSLTRFQTVAEIEDPDVRIEKVTELGMFMVEKQKELKALGDDPRIKGAEETLSDWFRMASLGQKPTWTPGQ